MRTTTKGFLFNAIGGCTAGASAALLATNNFAPAYVYNLALGVLAIGISWLILSVPAQSDIKPDGSGVKSSDLKRSP